MRRLSARLLIIYAIQAMDLMYILKLQNLVEDKMHARSIGNYSLETQKPLVDKAQIV